MSIADYFMSIFGYKRTSCKECVQGEIWFDSLGFPQCECRVCGKGLTVKPRSLINIDEITMDDVDELLKAGVKHDRDLE